MHHPDDRIDIERVIESMIYTLDRINQFWSAAHGWAPSEAADLLMNSRLDWLVSLGQCLQIWVCELPESEGDGPLILAWANVGALIEGSLKILLSVYLLNYQTSAHKVMKRGKRINPDSMQLEDLRQFCLKENIWHEGETWDAWLLHIQQRRNAIHAFRNRDIGTREEFMADLRLCHSFVRMIDSRLPYPYQQ